MSIGDKRIKISNLSTRGRHWAAQLPIQEKREEKALRSNKYSKELMLQVAMAIGEGKLRRPQIAKKFGVSAVTISNWMTRPLFTKKVREIREAFAQQVMDSALALKHNRVKAAQRDYDAIEKLQQERADHGKRIRQNLAEGTSGENSEPCVPGDTTGLIARRRRGENIEYAFDREIIEAKHKLREQIAVEVGDRDNSKDQGGSVKIEVVYVDEKSPALAEPEPVTIEVETVEETRSGEPAQPA